MQRGNGNRTKKSQISFAPDSSTDHTSIMHSRLQKAKSNRTRETSDKQRKVKTGHEIKSGCTDNVYFWKGCQGERNESSLIGVLHLGVTKVKYPKKILLL